MLKKDGGLAYQSRDIGMIAVLAGIMMFYISCCGD